MKCFTFATSFFLLTSSLVACTQATGDTASADTASADTAEVDLAAQTAPITSFDALAAGPRATRVVVDRSTDSTDGVCRVGGDSGGQCNLRAALALAATAPRILSITLAVDSVVTHGQFTIAPTGTQTTSSVRIAGTPGRAPKAIKSGGIGRAFQVAVNATLGLANVVVSGFNTTDPTGGGAILNAGTVQLQGVTISGNSVTCTETGAMDAFATCGGGAITSTGTLLIGPGTQFDANVATAQAETAAYTTSTAFGGAIATSGHTTIVAPVSFVGNSAVGLAQSGVHPLPDGAFASAGGGAVEMNGGSLTIVGRPGSCHFSHDVAKATASAPPTSVTPNPTIQANSRGGAIEASGGTLTIGRGTCKFDNNAADESPDEFIASTVTVSR